MERLQALHQALYPAVCIASPNGDFPFEPSPDHKVGTERMKLCARENPVNVLLRPLQVAGPQKYGNRPIQHDGERQGVVHAGGVFDSHVRALSGLRSEEHTSELQSLMRISYAVFCLNKKN